MFIMIIKSWKSSLNRVKEERTIQIRILFDSYSERFFHA